MSAKRAKGSAATGSDHDDPTTQLHCWTCDKDKVIKSARNHKHAKDKPKPKLVACPGVECERCAKYSLEHSKYSHSDQMTLDTGSVFCLFSYSAYFRTPALRVRMLIFVLFVLLAQCIRTLSYS